MFFRRKNNLDGLDLMILGGGSAAFAAAIRASELGARVVLAEVGGQRREFLAEKLLLAASLRPNTAGLGLEAAGVEVDRRGRWWSMPP